ncbi:uncharacterized protein CTRU02_208732 [Colletotrichum truncatum]|uniref:Uncharacterized protein n=1 Tax=Colletotrichum truncatum TaxID=5467 RepID=A0ACC3YXH4_COLTU
MAHRVFVDWELWQQMTFVLACCIGIVFIIGFVKLWWTNRLMARLEIIDAEKRAHVSEMESTGLPPQRKQSEIPFGVRAIQSGVEVDGIWISRPATPASESPPNSARAKGKYVSMAPVSPTSPNPDPFSSPTSSRGSYAPQTYRPKSMAQRNIGQADALRRLEGDGDAAAYQTYQPRGHNEDPYESGSADQPSGSYAGVDVRVPIRPPVNRHLSNARGGGGSPAEPKTGGGVRSFSGNLQLPNNGKKGYATVPQTSPGVSPGIENADPFATPARSPVTTPRPEQSLLGSHQVEQVTFMPEEYIPGQGSRRSSGSGSSSSS